MPQIFKALATITAWILFVSGCFGVVVGILMDLGRHPQSPQVWAVSVFALISAVVAMKLRQTL